MHFQTDQSSGPAMTTTLTTQPEVEDPKTSSLPFRHDASKISLDSFGGSNYSTGLTLVQQVAYLLSDKLFSYSPESFDLDVAVKQWSEKDQAANVFGFVPAIHAMETRSGAGTFALGYAFSPDFDMSKRHVPQSFLASSGSLLPLRETLDQLSLLHALTNPFVAHVSATDYDPVDGSLVADYTIAQSVADELGLGLVASIQPSEVQHMALLATALASVMPTIHITEGVATARETLKLKNVLSRGQIKDAYGSIVKDLATQEAKHLDTEGKTLRILKALNRTLQINYAPFEYSGHAEATHALVVFGSSEASLAQILAKHYSEAGVKVGVINVRIYRPFIEEEFLNTLPKSAKTVTVLGQVDDELSVSEQDIHSLLYKDVVTALTFSAIDARYISVSDIKYAPNMAWNLGTVSELFERLVETELPHASFEESGAQRYAFWDLDGCVAAVAPSSLAKMLQSQGGDREISISSAHDNLVQGGVTKTQIRVGAVLGSSFAGSADVTFVGSDKILKSFDFLSATKDGGSIALCLPGVQDEDLVKKIPEALLQGLNPKSIKLFILDMNASSLPERDPSVESILFQLAFYKIAGLEVPAALSKSLPLVTEKPEGTNLVLDEIARIVREVPISDEWTASHDAENAPPKHVLPVDIKPNSFVPFTHAETDEEPRLHDWTHTAKGLAFHEAYHTSSHLRPELGMQTCVIHVKEHRRLTPLSYDRNVFHIEFDLGTSGLQYSIGEALGIHAENHPDDISAFINWYGLDASEIVAVPSREDPHMFESRTIYQSLQQNLDIFGRPPKRFYESLSTFATDPSEAQALRTLSTPEGAVEFKRRAEVDTITFADVLREFPSARPSFAQLTRIVPPLKRREYSIASSQNHDPTSVALLIVTVGWVDPSGRDRFGLATRYLNDLPVGAPVVVSVKPSVMKLPAATTAPLIMAGLGTGLAPFRAFVQERAHQRFALGKDIGPVLLYLGSRHMREEYLYGEEWEAYEAAGVISLIGRAFSRDQKHKVYIQDRMRETREEIADAYVRREGSFYLCGPTWPVPDVTEVLTEVVVGEVMAKGAKRVDGRREIEGLKEGGRFVLEVY